MTRALLLVLVATASFLAPGFPALPQEEKEPAKKDDYKEKTARHKEDGRVLTRYSFTEPLWRNASSSSTSTSNGRPRGM